MVPEALDFVLGLETRGARLLSEESLIKGRDKAYLVALDKLATDPSLFILWAKVWSDIGVVLGDQLGDHLSYNDARRLQEYYINRYMHFRISEAVAQRKAHQATVVSITPSTPPKRIV